MLWVKQLFLLSLSACPSDGESFGDLAGMSSCGVGVGLCPWAGGSVQIAHGAPLQRHPRQSPQHFTNGSGVKLKATKPLAFTSSPEDGHLGTRDASARAAATCVLPTARSAGVTSLRRQLYNSNAVL